MAQTPLEFENVHNVYDKIAVHFDHTRFALWDGVKTWLKSIPAGSMILDVGCGNGKYLGLRGDDCIVFGCDPCAGLVEIAAAKNKNVGANVVVANGLALPYRDGSFDAVMSVAVFHHLSTVENRRQFVRELQRVLKPGGKMLVTVWATNAATSKPSWQCCNGTDYMVPWHDAVSGAVYERYYHLFTKEEVLGYFPDASSIWYEKENWFVAA